MKVEQVAPFVISTTYKVTDDLSSSEAHLTNYIKTGNKVTAVEQVYKTYNRLGQENYTKPIGQFINVQA